MLNCSSANEVTQFTTVKRAEQGTVAIKDELFMAWRKFPH